MLLRVVSPPPLPTILFTLSFPALPTSLSLPPAWEAHLQLLANAQLAQPPSLHALDKTVVWTALLDIVTFDLTSLTVTCTFIDGVHEEWPLTNRCVDLLESVVQDVNRSATEAEAEHEQQQQQYRQDTDPDRGGDNIQSQPVDPPPEQPPSPAPVTPQKTLKPKKRRSFFASLVTSIVTSSPFSGSAPSTRTPPPAPTPVSVSPLPIEEPECLITNGIPASRFLRRRARSTLVDVFRRFVVGELGARFRTGHPAAVYNPVEVEEGLRKQGGVDGPQTPYYALWVVRSTIRRVAEEMARIIEYALYMNETRESGPEVTTHKEDEQNKEDDRDGDDAGSATSTTDGSSVHTPLDYHDRPPLPPPLSSETTHRQASMRQGLTLLTPHAYHAYVSLKEMHHRLRDLAGKLTVHAAVQEQVGGDADAGGVEVRSRRRAWSTRQYLVAPSTSGSLCVAGRSSGFRGASMALLGLAVPVRSSPLCQGWKLEDMAAGDEAAAGVTGGCRVRWEADEDPALRGETLRRTRSLYGELQPQPQHGRRGRCRYGATLTLGRKSREAEDVCDERVLRSRTCYAPRVTGVGQQPPLALVYATGPGPRQRYRPDDHDDNDDEERKCDECEDDRHDEDDEDEEDEDEDENEDEGVEVSEVPVVEPEEQAEEGIMYGKRKHGGEDERGMFHARAGHEHPDHQPLHSWSSYPPHPQRTGVLYKDLGRLAAAPTANGTGARIITPKRKRLLPAAIAVAVEDYHATATAAGQVLDTHQPPSLALSRG